jgi:hypothetical protein
MSMPTIAPTGSMSSEEYCAYMVGYCGDAEEQLLEDLNDYFSQSTIDDWEDLWGRTLFDIGEKVTTLEESVKKLGAQVTMVSDAINKL